MSDRNIDLTENIVDGEEGEEKDILQLTDDYVGFCMFAFFIDEKERQELDIIEAIQNNDDKIQDLVKDLDPKVRETGMMQAKANF